MKASIFALGLAALATTAASAEPVAVRLEPISVSRSALAVTRNTITGYAASAAVEDGLPLQLAGRVTYDQPTLDKADGRPVTKNTITGYAASAAVAEGVPLNAVARSSTLVSGPIVRVRQVRDIPAKRERAQSAGQSNWDADDSNG
jgi:hypothetical protein